MNHSGLVVALFTAALLGAGCTSPQETPLAKGWGTLHADAASLSVARPQDQGMSSERLARLDAAITREIAEKRLPGAVIGIARHGRLVHTYVGGARDPATGAPMTRDSVFHIYSMTEPMVVATALTLGEEGRLQLTDPVSRYLPAIQGLQVSVPQRDTATGSTRFMPVTGAREMTVLAYQAIAD